jgi:hypothetical protein
LSPIGIEFVEEEDEEEEGLVEKDGTDEEEGEELSEDDPRVKEWADAFFIPLSLPELSERVYYRGEDPEWQAFIRFNQDQEKHQRVHGQYAASISLLY